MRPLCAGGTLVLASATPERWLAFKVGFQSTRTSAVVEQLREQQYPVSTAAIVHDAFARI